MSTKAVASTILILAIVGITWFVYARPIDTFSSAGSQSDQKRVDFDPVTVIEEPFPVIKDATFLSREDGSKQVSDATLVLGVSIDGIAKAYPIPMLCGPDREIINDRFGDQAVAATW